MIYRPGAVVGSPLNRESQNGDVRTRPIPSAHGFQQFSHFCSFEFELKQWFLAGQFQCPHCGFSIVGTLWSGASPNILNLYLNVGRFLWARYRPSGLDAGPDETSTIYNGPKIMNLNWTKNWKNALLSVSVLKTLKNIPASEFGTLWSSTSDYGWLLVESWEDKDLRGMP